VATIYCEVIVLTGHYRCSLRASKIGCSRVAKRADNFYPRFIFIGPGAGSSFQELYRTRWGRCRTNKAWLKNKYFAISSYTWIKRDQFDVTCFFISLFHAQHVSDVSTSILRSLRLVCWVISCVVLLWYVACWCCIQMQASACIRIPHHPSRTTS